MQTPTLTLIMFIVAALLLIFLFMVLLIWCQVRHERRVFRCNLAKGDELTLWHNKSFLTGHALSIDHKAATCVIRTDDDQIMHTSLKKVFPPFDQEAEQTQTLTL